MTLKMNFRCKLAHRPEIKLLTNFNSTKELYERISQYFSVPISQILYCTLNTHNFRDMDCILGNYLSSNDLIVVHLCGRSKELSLRKTQDYLGLTITDNGQGRAFVKKVNSDDVNVEKLIRPGDHIAALNSETTIGLRHYEVAKAIRDLPLNSNFSMILIEPEHLDSYMDDQHQLDRASPSKKEANLIGKRDLIGGSELNCSELSYVEDLIHSSLPMDRLLSKRSDEREDFDEKHQTHLGSQDNYKLTIERINSCLDSFLGINDNLLAIKIYRLAHENRHSFGEFSAAIGKSELSVFNFNEDIQNYLWDCATRVVV